MLDVVRGRRGPRPVSLVLRALTAAVVLLLGLPTPQALAAAVPVVAGPFDASGSSTPAPADDATPYFAVTGTSATSWCWSGAGTTAPATADPSTDPAWAPCAAEYASAGPLADGGSWTVAAVDFEGGVLSGPDSRTHTYTAPVDTTAPAVAVGDLGTGAAETPEWAVTVDDPAATLACTVTGPGGPVTPVTCGPAFTVDLADDPQGLYTLEVTATDLAGNAAGDTGTYTLDRAVTGATVTAEASPARGGAGATPETTWTLVLAGVTPGATLTCSLSRAGVELATPACAATVTTPLTDGDGTYRLTVTADDGVGAPATASADFVLDRTDPVVAFTSTPPASASAAPLDWAWTVTDANPGTTSCTLTVDATPGAPEPCTTPYSVAAPADGSSYSLEVTATDDAGNTGTAPSGPHAYDGNAPSVSLSLADDTGSAAVMPAATAASPDADAVVTCVVTDPDGDVLYPAGPCSGVAGLPLTDEGAHAVVATATDGVNSTSSPAQTYVLDRVAPTAVTVTSPPSPTNDPSATWSVDPVAAGDTRTCRFVVDGDDPAFGACPSPLAFPSTTGTTYRLEVRDTDAAGNSTTSPSSDVVLDLAGPATPVFTTGLPATGPEAQHTVAFALPAPEAGTTFQCRLDGPTPASGYDWTGCSTPMSVAFAEQGAYVLQVRAVDTAGNLSSGTASTSYTRDSVVPPTPTVTGPTGTGNDTSVEWAFTPDPAGSTTDDVVRAVCVRTLDGLTAQTIDPCTTPVTYPSLTGEGTHRMTVTLYDAAGNSASASSDPYLLDTLAPSAPVVALLPGPSPTNDPSIGFSWTGAEAPSAPGRVECLLTTDGSPDPAGWQACASPLTLTGVADGSHVLSVRVVDAALNVGDTGQSSAYVVDTGDPTTPVFDAQPTSPVADGSGTWEVSAEPGTTLTCRLTEAAATPAALVACGDLLDVVVLGPGSWSLSTRAPVGHGTWALEVVSTDAAQNASGTAVSDPWVVDLEGPAEPTVTGPSGKGNDPLASWDVVLTEVGATAECRLSTTAPAAAVVTDWTDCTTPPTFETQLLDDGTYVLEARSTDDLGNTGPSGSSLPYDFKATLPVLSAVDGPSGPDNDPAPQWTFTTDGTRTECRLVRDGSAGAWSDCTSPETRTLTATGSYELEVVAHDDHGNSSDVETSPAYDYDQDAPAAPDVAVSSSPSQDPTPTFTWVTAAGDSSECRLRLASDTLPLDTWSGCASGLSPALSADGSWVLDVRLVDDAGNTGPHGTSPVYVLDRQPPPAPVATDPAGPTRFPTATWSLPPLPDGGVRTCRVVLDGVGFTAEGPCGTALGPVALGDDGLYQVEATDTDAAGNVSDLGTSPGLVLDTQAPGALVVSGPTGPAQSRSVGWTLTGEAATATCTVVRSSPAAGEVVVAPTACTGTFSADLTGQADGGFVLEATAADAAGNLAPTGRSLPYVLDTTGPAAPTVSGPSGPSPTTTPTFSWTGEGGTTATCSYERDGSPALPAAPCSNPTTPALSGDGDWVVTVTLTDAAGNVGAPGSSGAYALDTTAPLAPTVAPPTPTGRDRLPTWGVVAEVGTTLECQLSSDRVLRDWTACAAPFDVDLGGLPDATYVLSVRATDAAGLTGPAGSGSYVLDTVAPGTPTVTVARTGRSTAPVFSFTTEPGTTAVCRLSAGGTLVGSPRSCSSPTTVDLSGLADGPYNLNVRLTDAAGNTGFGGIATYVLDRTAPAVPVFVVRPASPSPERTPVWELRAETGATLDCDVLFPTGAVRELTGCASPLAVDLSTVPEGTYTLRVRAVDAAGNASAAATDAHVLDLSAIAAPVVTAPPSPSGDGRPTFRFTTPAGTTTECRFTAPDGGVLTDWTRCDASYTGTLFGLAEGTYRFAVRARTATATSAAAVASYAYDTTAPAAPTVLAPPSPSTVATPVFTISSPEPGATASCRLLRFGAALTAFAPCPVSAAGAQHAVSLDSDGSYGLEVTVTDLAGRRSPVASATYVLNRDAAPGVSVTGPASPGSDATPTWELVTAAGFELECRVTGPDGTDVVPLGPCTSPFTVDLELLPDGTYALTVRAVTAAGAVGPDTTAVYELSRGAPSTPTDPVGPSGEGSDRTPTWTFSLPEGASGAVCTVWSEADQTTPFVRERCDDGRFTLDLTRAEDGSYTLTVVALSPSGVESEPSRPVVYVLTTRVAPAPVFTLEPGSPSSTLDPTWRFTHEGRSAECRVLEQGAAAGAFTVCASPRTVQLGTRPDGRYALEVRAVNVAGAGPAASSAYVLDRSALPLPVVTSAPTTPSQDRSPTWAFTVPAGFSAECAVLSGSAAWVPCSGSFTPDLPADGTHRIGIRLTDGTTSGAAVTATYVLDTTPPASPVFTLVPTPSPGSDTSVAWGWSLPTGTRADCLLTTPVSSGSWTADCGTRRDLRVLDGRQGSYELAVRSRDAAGNLSAAATSSYVLDTVSPVLLAVRPPASPSTDTSPTWGLTLPAGLRSATCTTLLGQSVVGTPVSCLSGRYDMPLAGAAAGVYTLQVVLVDAAGNRTTTTAGTYELRSGRLVAPVPPTGGPTGPVDGGTGAPTGPAAPGGPLSPVAPGTPADPEGLPRAGGATSVPPASPDAPVAQPPQRTPIGGGNALGDRLQVPGAIADAVSDTFRKPQLPLALLVVVVLFLLVQNRIDRRDPKLAGAEPHADDDLTFGPAYRPGGAPA